LKQPGTVVKPCAAGLPGGASPGRQGQRGDWQDETIFRDARAVGVHDAEHVSLLDDPIVVHTWSIARQPCQLKTGYGEV
jgi:hypothetical protein